MHSYKVQTKDQLFLHVQRWNDTKKPKGIICIIHGLGEHQGRYAHVAKFYSDNGFQVYSYDQRGHGKSEGKRGHTPGLESNLDDLERIIKTTRIREIAAGVIPGSRDARDRFSGRASSNFCLSSFDNPCIDA